MSPQYPHRKTFYISKEQYAALQYLPRSVNVSDYIRRAIDQVIADHRDVVALGWSVPHVED